MLIVSILKHILKYLTIPSNKPRNYYSHYKDIYDDLLILMELKLRFTSKITINKKDIPKKLTILNIIKDINNIYPNK